MIKADDIIAKIDRIHSAEKPLYDRFTFDYRMWRGEPQAPEEGYHAFTDNTAEVQGNKSILLMAKAKNHIFIPINEDKKGKRKKKSLSERFYLGWLDAANALREDNSAPDIQSEMAWHAFVRGWIVVIPLIYKTTGGKTVVKCIFWDRLHTTYEKGPNGLKWAAYSLNLKVRDAEAEFDIKLKGRDDEDFVKVVHYYDDKVYGLIVDGKWAKRPKEHQIGFNPVLVIPCGAAPYIFDSAVSDAFKDQGESGFKGIRNMVEPYNAMMSA